MATGRDHAGCSSIGSEGGYTELLSLKPKVFLYHNFLSKEECEHLISFAQPHLTRSKVINGKTGETVVSSSRTSSGMFFMRGRGKVIMDIEKRIADLTDIPVENGEGIQVIHYEKGQKCNAHHDYFTHELYTKNGGQRMATLLMYLSDVEEGGETVFPKAEGINLMLCGKSGLSVKPKMGDALFFWNLRPDLTLDPLSLHEACPVVKGSKWAATKWMHVGKYKV